MIQLRASSFNPHLNVALGGMNQTALIFCPLHWMRRPKSRTSRPAGAMAAMGSTSSRLRAKLRLPPQSLLADSAQDLSGVVAVKVSGVAPESSKPSRPAPP